MGGLIDFIKEKKIKRGLKSGDPGSIEMLFEAYADKLYLYAISLLNSAEEAEEAVQNLFLKLVRNPSVLNEIKSIRAYLYAGTKNESINVRNKRKKDLSLDDGGLESMFAAETTGREDLAVLKDAVEELPPEQKEVVVLKVYEGLSFKEIGAVLEISLNTAASRYRYALNGLRQKLEGDDK
ncbi:MAG: RNA polymerase sigma factor [Chloroflexi bacterium]|nr:RNA polymerase sigma factor [Chloroflexota bacterium]